MICKFTIVLKQHTLISQLKYHIICDVYDLKYIRASILEGLFSLQERKMASVHILQISVSPN